MNMRRKKIQQKKNPFYPQIEACRQQQIAFSGSEKWSFEQKCGKGRIIG